MSLPPSPPETNPEQLRLLTEIGEESAGSRFRKIVYQKTGLKEARDRSIQRSAKFLVVVIPPPCIVQNHGSLGHNLSTGPEHRLAAGVLMPLFPTASHSGSHDIHTF